MLFSWLGERALVAVRNLVRQRLFASDDGGGARAFVPQKQPARKREGVGVGERPAELLVELRAAPQREELVASARELEPREIERRDLVVDRLSADVVGAAHEEH